MNDNRKANLTEHVRDLLKRRIAEADSDAAFLTMDGYPDLACLRMVQAERIAAELQRYDNGGQYLYPDS